MTENPFLSGNYAPVTEETTAFDLPVQGEIPPSLRGRLLRIGSNPVDADPATYHWFLGNGMVHGVRIADGRAEWYRNRFVRDQQVVAVRGGDPVPGPANLSPGPDVVNTNVIGHAGRTFALVEGGSWPMELSDELETVCRTDFAGTLNRGFTAHPKRDPATGELFAACYSLLSENLQVMTIGVDGKVSRCVEVPMPHRPMIHDCAITERYFLIMDMPCVFDLQAMIQGSSIPIKWQPERGARVGLLPRTGDVSDIVWCEVEPCYVYHPQNAYDHDDGHVVFDVVRHPSAFNENAHGPGEGPPVLERWHVNPKGGAIRTERVDERAQEFPRIDERLVGRPHRYGYGVAINADAGSHSLLKHDMHTGRTEVHDDGPQSTYFEPVFVPARADADEDEGYVLAYSHNAERNAADVLILNAQDFAAAPLATIQLPVRVPYGFHGNWVADA